MLCANKRSYILKSSTSTKSGVLKYRIKVITIIIIKIIINKNNNNYPRQGNNIFRETSKYWVDVQRGIVSSHGDRDPL